MKQWNKKRRAPYWSS